ncbi:hypothetical protein Hanom_Chr15g01395581 [Helianthus anomalus]
MEVGVDWWWLEDDAATLKHFHLPQFGQKIEGNYLNLNKCKFLLGLLVACLN